MYSSGWPESHDHPVPIVHIFGIQCVPPPWHSPKYLQGYVDVLEYKTGL